MKFLNFYFKLTGINIWVMFLFKVFYNVTKYFKAGKNIAKKIIWSLLLTDEKPLVKK